MKMLSLDRDAFDRTLLIGMVAGTHVSHEAADAARRQFGIQVTVDDLSTAPRQAALLAAVRTAVRAAGIVGVFAPDAELERSSIGGPLKGRPLQEVITAEGARLGSVTAQTLVEIVIGDGMAIASGPAALLRVTWDGWIARVYASTPPPPPSDDSTNVLAAVAASALAVHEAFGVFNKPAGRDDGYRDLELNLWTLDGSATLGPSLKWAPRDWWLVGLGHLGQANAWVLSWLGLPPDSEVILQDDGLLSDANHSTGVLTPPWPRPERKVRLIARALEGGGLKTRIIEQRFAGESVAEQQRHYVALFGVDKSGPRREISNAGWDHVIDVGIGTGPDDFDSLLLHRFPGAGDSHDIPSWKAQTGDVRVPDTPAFKLLSETHDVCGVIELAGTAVGAAFVGLFAATLAIAEAARSLNGGVVYRVARVDLGHWKIRSAQGQKMRRAPAAAKLGTYSTRAGAPDGSTPGSGVTVGE